MSRRDTIIIAILVNAGLLMVLFATAMRSDKADKKEPLQISKLDLKKGHSEEYQDLLNEPLNQTASTFDLEPEEIIFSDSMDEEELVLASPIELTPTPIPELEKRPISSKTYETVAVKKGDVLEKIARSHGTSVAAIMEINSLSSTQLKIG